MRKAFQFTALMPQECSIPFERFTGLMRVFLNHAPDTVDIEHFALSLREHDFQGQDPVSEFVQRVCNWGGYAGIAGRVLQNNTLERIVETLRNATAVVESRDPDIGNALRIVTDLNGLGLSFASKHLRFLFPNLCPVFDRIISERMFYASDLDGYRTFGRDCRMVASVLTNEAMPHPILPRQGSWYPADVEASIYSFLQGWA